MIRKEYLEELIINATLEEFGKSQTIDEIVSTLIKIQDKLIAENTNLKLLIREKSRIAKSLENILIAIENGIISNTTNKRLHELEEQQEDLERKIIIEKAKTQIKVPESVMRSYYMEMLELEPQMLINFFVKEIVLFDDRIEIFYNNPIKNGPDNSLGFLFYNGVKGLNYTLHGYNTVSKQPILIEMYI